MLVFLGIVVPPIPRGEHVCYSVPPESLLPEVPLRHPFFPDSPVSLVTHSLTKQLRSRHWEGHSKNIQTSFPLYAGGERRTK